MSRSLGARVSRDRIDRVPVRPLPDRPVTGHFGDEAITAMPKRPTRTEEEKAARAAEDAAEDLDMARCVARYVMVRGHGCTGVGCRERAHGEDAGFMGEVLAMLRLKPGA